jgi:hypothetical protein
LAGGRSRVDTLSDVVGLCVLAEVDAVDLDDVNVDRVVVSPLC